MGRGRKGLQGWGREGTGTEKGVRCPESQRVPERDVKQQNAAVWADWVRYLFGWLGGTPVLQVLGRESAFVLWRERRQPV